MGQEGKAGVKAGEVGRWGEGAVEAEVTEEYEKAKSRSWNRKWPTWRQHHNDNDNDNDDSQSN